MTATATGLFGHPTEEAEMRAEDLDPRDLRNRYRVYRVRDGEQVLLSTTPTASGIGVAIKEHGRDGDLTGDDRVGVLDTHGVDLVGDWLPGLNPYATGGTR